MWSSGPSRTSSSGSQDRPPSSLSHHRRAEGARPTGSSGSKHRADDVWKLDDSDNEDSGDIDTAAHGGIARVAAQAGLGRKGSASSLALQQPAPVSIPTSTARTEGSAASRAPSAAAMSIAASLTNGASSSSTSRPELGSPTKTSGASVPKERPRQASYGFWERLSGLGAAVTGASSSSSTSASSSSSALSREKDRDRDNDSYVQTGYARFDAELELEDNFDGTYSVNASSSSVATPGTSGSSGKLLAPASISRPSLGGSGALSSGKVPTTASTTGGILHAPQPKGKSRMLESPGGTATIVGTPRARSPLARRNSERPRDEDDMKRMLSKDIEEIMKDPVNLLKNLSLAAPPPTSGEPTTPNALGSLSSSYTSNAASDYYDLKASPETQTRATFVGYDSPLADASPDAAQAAGELAKIQAQARRDATRREKFIECLSRDTVDIAELRKLAWAGVPHEIRSITWQLLLGYLPSPSSRRVSVLARKRQEYADAVRLAFSRGEAALDATLWHQIRIDVPRTNPGVPLWQFPSTQKCLERILYVWAIRHPASGYVQGINDLATPFFQVFLSSYIDCDPEDYDISALPAHVLSALEADTFWCLSKLLDGIQDNYIFAQPGIHRQVARCQDLCFRVDAPLAKHLESEGVSFLQFSFRWFHLLFLRVLPVNSVIRMWDTYMSEGSDAFANFHTYVCLAFLLRWSEKLRSMDFQGIMLFLQDPVDHETWSESMTELLLSEGYMWSALWSGTKNSGLVGK